MTEIQLHLLIQPHKRNGDYEGKTLWKFKINSILNTNSQVYMKWQIHTNSKAGLSKWYLYIIYTYAYECMYNDNNKISNTIDLREEMKYRQVAQRSHYLQQ